MTPPARTPATPPARIPVALLGATGTVGQRFALRLADHPWFELTRVFASARSAGQPYKRAARWLQPSDMPPALRNLPVEEATPAAVAQLASQGVPLAFSALGADEARALEPAAAAGGTTVFSNASAFRMHPAVPLVVPEVNAEHLALCLEQDWSAHLADATTAPRRGALITNPNCSTVGLVMALAPLARRFGLARVRVVTLQALSGAGLVNGQPLSIGDNVVPHIPGEADKLRTEPQKLLGTLEQGVHVMQAELARRLEVRPAPLVVSATTTRVPVSHGHTLVVSVELGEPATRGELEAAWREWRARPQELELPSAPAQPIHVVDAPQPLHHRDLEGGMAVAAGALEHDPVFDQNPEATERARGWSFVTLSHNLERGAAGGSVLNAELWVATQPEWKASRP